MAISPHDIRARQFTSVKRGGYDQREVEAFRTAAAEALTGLGVSRLVGVAIIEEARDAAFRDRPGIYDHYYVADFCEPSRDFAAALRTDRLVERAAAGPAALASAALEVLRGGEELLHRGLRVRSERGHAAVEAAVAHRPDVAWWAGQAYPGGPW